jgi:hypothetical protein
MWERRPGWLQSEEQAEASQKSSSSEPETSDPSSEPLGGWVTGAAAAAFLVLDLAGGRFSTASPG